MLAEADVVMPPGRVAVARDACAGWPAALRAVASAIADMSGESPDEVVIRRAARTFVRERVLPAQPADVQEFLETASQPERLTAESATIATGRCDASDVLERLELDGVLSASTVDGEVVFQLPELIRDALVDEFDRSRPAAFDAVHTRLSQWYRDRGHAHHAIAHAVRVSDWDLALELIDAQWLDLMRRHPMTLDKLFARAPAEAVAAHPVSSLVRDLRCQLVSGIQVPVASTAVSHAVDAFDQASGFAESTELGIALVVSARRRGDLDQANRIAAELMRRWRKVENADLREVASRAPSVGLQVGIAYQLVGNLPAAEDALSMAYWSATASPYPSIGADAAGRLATLHALSGDTAPAIRWLGRAEHVAAHAAVRPSEQLGISVAQLLLSVDALDDVGVTRAWNGLNAHLAVPDEQLSLAVYGLAQRSIVRGDRLDALRHIASHRLQHSGWLGPRALAAILLSASEAELLLTLHRFDEARAVLDRAPSSEPIIAATRARWMYCAGDFARAHAVAAEALASRPTWRRTRVGLHLVLAAVALQQRREQDAAEALADAVTCAGPDGGLVRQFALAPRDLLERFVDRMRGVRGVIDALDAQGIEEALPRPVVLTEREQLLLRKMVAGAEPRDLSRELFVSANTIKTQLRSIYRKLGVSSRARAIEAATRLGLVAVADLDSRLDLADERG
jgi:LuxR family transcriptional regulator, maltose regulon positive regulatory protein